MPPIRVALAGLSASAKTSWASDAHLPYLVSSRGQSRYEIVALLNSSKSAAEDAKARYALPTSVKTYGDPQELALDPDVDLVVVNTRVDVHYKVLYPSLAAGKASYVEWPLADGYAKANELLSLLKAPALPDSRTAIAHHNMISLQGRASPVLEKLTETLSSGRIGQVLSSDVRAWTNLGQPGVVPDSLNYFLERKVGGSPVTITLMHLLDFVHALLGDFSDGTVHSHMQIQRPTVKLAGPRGDIRAEAVSDVPDLVSVHGVLDTTDKVTARQYVQPGASLTAIFRSGPPGFGAPLVWTIVGERGEIRVTNTTKAYLQIDERDAPIAIELHDYESNKTEVVPWGWPEWQQELPFKSRNVAEMYERFADRWENGQGRPYPDFEVALRRHRQVELFFRQWDEQRSFA